MEENVGIDRHWKIDTIGPHDKQGKIDALERYFGLPGFQGYGLARLVGLFLALGVIVGVVLSTVGRRKVPG